MASITFTHALAGAQTLQSSWPNIHARRFQNWQPKAKPRGEFAIARGDGRLYRNKERDDAFASFEITGIHRDTNLVIAQYLMHHLEDGGICSVITDDIYGNIYPTCSAAPDGNGGYVAPDIMLVDRVTYEHAMLLTLVNVDPALTLLQCVY